MAFKLTPPIFRREVERRLMDVHAVKEHAELAHTSSVFKRVKAGTLPRPIVSGGERRFAFWDRDEIESFQPDTKKEK